MGYDVLRFQGEVDEELLCPICLRVLEDPLQAPQCEHAFCKECINKWLSRSHFCPVDRQAITPPELKQVPRILRNMLSKLQIFCEYSNLGCPMIVKLDRLVVHLEECDYNPKKPVPCALGCGLVIPQDKLKEHNCIKELRHMVQDQQFKLNDLQVQFNELKLEFDKFMNPVQNFLHTFPSPNPSVPAVVEAIEQVEALEWSSSLQRARVTRWGGMISTPDSVLQALVRSALIESGCPLRITDQLMENAHERHWPLGLSTLETRQSNRRYYENYVCRRIPGKQAVVVMAADNSHMNDDLLLHPGLVMIFAHGIE